jgi:hypothetical protein
LLDGAASVDHAFDWWKLGGLVADSDRRTLDRTANSDTDLPADRACSLAGANEALCG